MAGKRKAVVSLLLLSLLGCHQDEPEAVERAKKERFHAKQLFTDRASLLYAQQELDLAKAKAAAAQAMGLPIDVETGEAANNHLQQAKLQLQLDSDTSQLDEDQERWKSLAQMLAERKPGGGHP